MQLTFWQQVIMGLIHGGMPTATIYLVGLWIVRGQKRHAERMDTLHEQLNGGLEEKIKSAIQEILREHSE